MHFTINGTLAYIYSIRRDNPLEREDDVKQKAGAFWREHKLHMVVQGPEGHTRLRVLFSQRNKHKKSEHLHASRAAFWAI
jgi:hypothetical protein